MKDIGKSARLALLGQLLILGLSAGCATEAPQSSPRMLDGLSAGGPSFKLPMTTAGAGGQGALPGATASNGSVAAGPGAAPTAPGETLWCGVKRTLDSRCTACHNEQKVAGAPMSLRTYADLMVPAITDRTKKVYQVVGVRVHDTVRPMPPQERLTPVQIDGIDKWVAAGGPIGTDPNCAVSAALPGN